MKKKNLFSENDFRQMKSLGISPATVENQLAVYRHGPHYLKLDRPCNDRDGINIITTAQTKKLIDLYERESVRYKLIKFVPASGAASRMFNEWFPAKEKGSFGSRKLNEKFLRDLRLFPFFPLIEENKEGKKLLAGKDIKGLLEFILGEEDLNYGNKPKALIPFHRYTAGVLRTALEEHLIEAGGYIRSGGNLCRMHFTLSREHKNEVRAYLKAVIARYEDKSALQFKISSSIQSAATNTMAVDENNLPIRDAKDELVFRPGGHGALLNNLNKLNADFIFVKNIDNIVPAPLLERNLAAEKMMGGLALQIRNEIFAILRNLEAGSTSAAEIDQFAEYCSKKLSIVFPRWFTRQAKKKKIQTIYYALNRPLRICGMVKNAGEPGGGPFWVTESDGTQTLQIVENGQVDKNNHEQAAIWSQAKYFNPVDMVCCIKNYQGEKFVLDDYVNKDACLITTKYEKGMTLKALELPGLWNGGMAYWNTIFVNIPIRVFNPVKTVYDLLRPEHLRTQ